jgi:predicted metal-dependent peptidase
MKHNNLSKAKAKLLVNHPAFGHIATKMKFIPDDNVQFFKSDGKEFFYNETFLTSAKEEELIFALSHASLHLILNHTQRQQKRSNFLWQLATDYAISAMLKESGFFIPEFAVYQSRFDGMYAEEIYAILQDETTNKEELEEMQKQTTPSSQTQETLQEELELEKRLAQKFVENLLQEHYESFPQAVKRTISLKPKPSLNWKYELKNAITRYAKNDYSLYPPSKKLLYDGVYLPSLKSETLQLCIVIDSSKSIDDVLLERFFNEVAFILLGVSAYEIDLIIADDKVREHIVLTPATPFPSAITGGCSTDFRVVFEYIEKKRLHPKLLLFFSDLEGIFPQKKPPFHVVWVSTSFKEVPFGKVIVLKTKNRS